MRIHILRVRIPVLKRVLKRVPLLLGSIVLICAMFHACSSNNSMTQPQTTPPAWTDASIFDTAKVRTGMVWYKKTDSLFTKGSKSGHVEPLLRTRYNSTAAQMLDASGKVKAGAVFAEGSIIVKELVLADRTTISTYAVMIKQKSDPNADAQGWVWGYVTGAGGVRDAVSRKGAGCIGCHSIAGHIDNTLMNFDHP
jgi:hypothetical protein